MGKRGRQVAFGRRKAIGRAVPSPRRTPTASSKGSAAGKQGVRHSRSSNNERDKAPAVGDASMSDP